MLIYLLSTSYLYRLHTASNIVRVYLQTSLTFQPQHTYSIMINKFSFMSRILLTCLLGTMFIGVLSSPLPLTPNNTTSLASRLEERNQVVRSKQVFRSISASPKSHSLLGYSGQYSSLTARLLRTNKQGKIIKPGTKVTKDEEWTLFIGPDGFNASPGPGGTLIAQTARREIRSGFSLGTSKSTQDLGEKASFGSAVERDKVFNELLTKVPALHAGNGVPKTNLAYLNGIFAYLYSVKAVHNPEPPEAWVKLYNEMHALGGSAD
ncbi:hypothetical protein F5878DRAFT_322482 [Lentinula raphanica]|uniref:Uncharacterized protein n=1 Tax=Lentinula raphanica TaxID=153919 RepID=A0AA38PHS4_9AGAR|nr:hypothetical protein F5878DRAFT_322482 [Lentinula raphanica]